VSRPPTRGDGGRWQATPESGGDLVSCIGTGFSIDRVVFFDVPRRTILVFLRTNHHVLKPYY
jgi:hypothetical protein